jgi:hypothetical protein
MIIRTAKLACAVLFVLGCGKKADDKPAPKAEAGSGTAAAAARPDPAKPEPTAAPDKPEAAGPKPVCSFLTVAEATAILGAPAKYVTDTPDDPEVADCEVTTDTDDKLGLTAMFNPRMSKSDYEAGLAAIGDKDQKPVAVAGLGDAAFWIGSEILPRLWVLKGDHGLYVHILEPYGKPGPQDKAVELARTILARL